MMTGNYMVSAQANNGFGEVRHSIEVDTFGQGESRTYGGCDEAESVSGHLDSVEQVVKPALGRAGFAIFCLSLAGCAAPHPAPTGLTGHRSRSSNVNEH